MFGDHSLLPREIIRLATLGLLSECPLTYTDLAIAVHGVVEQFAGPSTELSGPSIELFRYEGLVAPVEERDDALLRLTEAGRRDLADLLAARVRPPLTDLSNLVISLKLRFLCLLEEEERRRQVDGIVAAYDSEMARLTAYVSRAEDKRCNDNFLAWLRNEIDLANRRIRWLRELRSHI